MSKMSFRRKVARGLEEDKRSPEVKLLDEKSIEIDRLIDEVNKLLRENKEDFNFIQFNNQKSEELHQKTDKIGEEVRKRRDEFDAFVMKSMLEEADLKLETLKEIIKNKNA